MKVSHVHPFPARMASELALAKTKDLEKGATVLDPMTGSGTVLRAASGHGHKCIGLDVDPLAVLMSKVATSKIDEDRCQYLLNKLIDRSLQLDLRRVTLPWFDEETVQFVEYWFAPNQRRALVRLANIFSTHSSLNDDSPEANVLRLTLSKLIIAKDRGASLARDVSHSRPHRVADENDFDVIDELRKATDKVCKQLAEINVGPRPVVRLGDARALPWVRDKSIDMIMTSPPYLNAIDYMRGHRLSLVWLGHSLASLRSIRSNSIGAERGLGAHQILVAARQIVAEFGDVQGLPTRDQGMIDRYSVDLVLMTQQAARVLRKNGKAVFVVGNSCLRNVFISNARGLEAAAGLAGLRLIDDQERELPVASRYLPMPADSKTALGRRMRTETVLTFEHSRRTA